MFGNSYSTLNILPNGIQYVNSYSILIFFFFLFLSKNQTLSVELENDTKCFYLIWMFFLSFMKTHIEWAKTYLRISEITSPILEGPLFWSNNIWTPGMRHYEGKEVLLLNIGGRFYTIVTVSYSTSVSYVNHFLKFFEVKKLSLQCIKVNIDNRNWVYIYIP